MLSHLFEFCKVIAEIGINMYSAPVIISILLLKVLGKSVGG